MSFVLLLLAVCLLVLYFFVKSLNHYGPFTAIRYAIVYSLVGHAGLIYLYNEILSLFNLIYPYTALIFWALLSGFYLFLISRLLQNTAIKEIKYSLRNVFLLADIQSRYRILLYVVLVFFVLPLACLAVAVPPNNFDSHNYHLNRVMEWYYNHNVAHFPTLFIQQLYHNVFAEYLVLHTYLLTGFDRFANTIQFGAMLGSVMAISLLGKEFGFRYPHQIFVGLLWFCLPIGVFESTTTQVDYVACFFYICFVLLGYRLVNSGSFRIAFLCFLSLAFAGFSKYPALFYALPFCIYFAYLLFRRYALNRVFLLGFMSVAVFCVVFGPFFTRNYQLFGSVLSPLDNSRLFDEKVPVENHSAGGIISNLVKNMGLHLGLPNYNYNVQLDALINGFHRLINVPLNHPDRSFDDYHTRFSVQEDMAPNSFHFYLFLLLLPILFIKSENWSIKRVVLFAFAGLLLAGTFLRFDFWSSRTQMPFFSLVTLTIVYVFYAIFRSSGFWVCCIYLLTIVPIVYGNPNKTILPFKYTGKKLLAHIPRDILIVDKVRQERYKKVLATEYDFAVSDSLFPLKSSRLDYAHRSALFAKLDNLGYYNEDKEGNIFTSSPVKLMFQSHLSDYPDFQPLLPYFGTAKNIGVFFTGYHGFYHYWSAVQYNRDYSVEMRYIRFKREMAALPNAQTGFRYDYIFTDNLKTLLTQLPASEIDTTYTSGKLALLRLKHPSGKQYLF